MSCICRVYCGTVLNPDYFSKPGYGDGLVSLQDAVSTGVLICRDAVSCVSSEVVFNESFAQCSIINVYSVKCFIRRTCDDTSLISGVDLINVRRDVLNEQRHNPLQQSSQKSGQLECSVTSAAWSLHNQVHAGS